MPRSFNLEENANTSNNALFCASMAVNKCSLHVVKQRKRSLTLEMLMARPNITWAQSSAWCAPATISELWSCVRACIKDVPKKLCFLLVANIDVLTLHIGGGQLPTPM